MDSFERFVQREALTSPVSWHWVTTGPFHQPSTAWRKAPSTLDGVNDALWYQGIDVPSGCLWDSAALASVEPLTAK